MLNHFHTRQQHGMFIKASMGVCVQKMVNPDAAGVMFTRHPTTGDPSNIIITANYGLGEVLFKKKKNGKKSNML